MSTKRVKIDVKQVVAEHVALREALVRLFNATAYMENGGDRSTMHAIEKARAVLAEVKPIVPEKP